MDPGGARRVCIYRNRILPWSETFIAEQVRSIRRWRPFLAGRVRVDGGADATGIETVIDGTPCWHPFSGISRAVWLGLPPPHLLRDIAQRRPALMHAHFGRDAVAAAAMARRLRIPLIATIHGWELAQPIDRTTPMHACHDALTWRAMRRLFAVRAVTWVAVSRHVASALQALGAPAERLATLPIGVDLSRFSPQGARPVPGRILFAGRLVPIKACDVLMRAVALLVGAGRAAGIEVRIAGDGPERGRIAQAAAGLPVTMLGRIGPDQVREELRTADVLCVPSRVIDGLAESFGIVFAEAQAAGIPVVSTATGGIPEAVADGQTGLLVPPDDPPALAEALARLTGDRALRMRMSVDAAERTARLHGLAACTAALEDLYDRIADQEAAWG